MPTVKNNTTVISFAETETTPQKQYEAVRFNAMKHGILSKHVVLPHENKEEFLDLLNSLVEEHQPAGITEMHLIEELAGIMWRKRRVIVAEGASINRSLHHVMNNKLRSPIPAATPCNRSILNEDTDLHDLMKSTPEQTIRYHHEATIELEAANKAIKILRKGGPNVYKKAQSALNRETLYFWMDHVEDNEYPDTAEGFHQFIREILWPICVRKEYETEFTPAIQAQALGEGLPVEKLENLSRYETHLDRKFERTLAMILKIKEMRGNK